MIVYHYLNRQYGLESICLRRLRASVVDELKDPYEHRAFALSPRDDALFSRVIKQMGKPNRFNNWVGQGVISFCKSYDSPVMWSQYAQDHQGLCLGFKLIDNAGGWREVEYVPDRKPMRLLDVAMQDMLICATTKFQDWKYEHEVRALVPLDPARREGGNYFFDYCPQLKLTAVIAGVNCTLPKATIDRALGDLATDEVDRFKVRRNRGDFSMVRSKKQW
ncbi:MAG: DUF2971 domain-containing protein [Alphaproteobacteria bacterium]|nr:DUF2971 domain-containing protein [Alphaproteobacteria bacterium]